MMEVIDAISVRLDEIFGDGYTIYLEQVEQGLKTPCFFIQPIDSTDANMISNRKYRTNAFVIEYIPDDNSGHRTQFVEVSEKLFDNFDSLEIGDGVVLQTFDRSINSTDDMLQFVIRFKYYVYKEQKPEQKMEDLHMSVV